MLFAWRMAMSSLAKQFITILATAPIRCMPIGPLFLYLNSLLLKRYM